MTKLNVTLQTETEDLIWHLVTELDHEQLAEFVTDLDLHVADVGFTEALIDALQTSLNDEAHPEEIG